MNEVLIVAVIVIALMQLFIISRLFKNKGDSTSDSIDKLREDIADRLNARLDANQKLMLNTVQKQSQESNRIVADITRQLTQIKESNKQVVSVTDELKTLQNILQNPKQRGVLGEYYLQTVLENVLPPERFQMQYKFKDGEMVDAVIFLDKNKMLPVDSKFSLENYNRLVEARDKEERQRLVGAFKVDLKNRIDETAKYIRPHENTMDFAFMFIPSEAIYYDLLINKVGTAGTSARDLIEYAFRDKKVIIVSPTSFMAYLQTVLQGLRSLQIEEKAKEIQEGVIKLSRHISSYDDYMVKLGKSLGITVNHFNSAHKELQKVDRDVTKIAGVAPRIEPVIVDSPDIQN